MIVNKETLGVYRVFGQDTQVIIFMLNHGYFRALGLSSTCFCPCPQRVYFRIQVYLKNFKACWQTYLGVSKF